MLDATHPDLPPKAELTPRTSVHQAKGFAYGAATNQVAVLHCGVIQ